MRIFSGLRVFVFLCVVFLYVVSSANAQDPFLEVLGSTGFDQSSNVGDPLEVTFRAGFGRAVQAGIPLRITATSSIKVISPLPVPGTHRTGLGGILIVKGTLIKANVDARIHAVWVLPSGGQRSASAKIQIDDDPVPAPAVIVVNSPVVDSPNPEKPLSVGGTFTQEITIENRHPTGSTLPLSAWQMDVVYNPLILKVVDVAEGDLLMKDDPDAAENTVSTHYIEQLSPGRIRVSQSRPVHTDNDPPSPDAKDGMDDEAAPRPLGSPAGIELEPGDDGTLLTITFEVLVAAEEPLGIHNVRLQSSENYDADGTFDRISFSILTMDGLSFESSEPVVDVNQDGDVNILDLVMVANNIAKDQPDRRADVNGDGSVNVLDLVTIYTSEHWNESALKAPSVRRNVNPTTIQTWIDLARIEDDGSAIFNLGIANLEALLASRIPSETKLLLNYPNPFNPETWIPYQLSASADVSVSIYAVDGRLVRRLDLGHQVAGVYRSRSRAAYWDGRNSFGERIASGLYFYTLTAGDFTATRKMLIRK